MIHEQSSVVIERAAEDVWALVSDLTTLPQWDPGATEVRLEGQPGVGATFTITALFLGGQRKGRAQITDYEFGRRIGWRVRPPGPEFLWRDSWLGATYVVEALDGARTKLTRIFDANAAGLLGRLAEPLVRRRARRERSAEIDNVKRLLELRSPP
jgi:carbon monoxide dehydrogenase subunit G